MPADTNVSLAKWLAAVAVLLVCGGCASGAWRWTNDDVLEWNPVPSLSAHRAVERVTLRVHGHELEFVGYRSCDPKGRDVRAQLLLDSGISALDVAVHGSTNERISGSAFEAIPHFADIAMEDLRRVWGSRSLFCLKVKYLPMMQRLIHRTRKVTDGRQAFQAEPLDDGTWLATTTTHYDTSQPLTITLLDRDLVPEATIAYSDFDDDGVPREIHLVDLRNHHTLDVEVEEVHVVAKPAGPAK